MKCPYCAHVSSSVLDSRDSEDGGVIRRRRKCEKCKKRWTTYERTEGVDLWVIKKEGVREQFDREKLRRGIVKATWKRPVSMSSVEELIDEVERRLRLRKTPEIKSWEIGNLVINRLRKLDPLSYLLFASVYRDFSSLDDFQKELEKLAALSEEKQCESGDGESVCDE